MSSPCKRIPLQPMAAPSLLQRLHSNTLPLCTVFMEWCQEFFKSLTNTALAMHRHPACLDIAPNRSPRLPASSALEHSAPSDCLGQVVVTSSVSAYLRRVQGALFMHPHVTATRECQGRLLKITCHQERRLHSACAFTRVFTRYRYM